MSDAGGSASLFETDVALDETAVTLFVVGMRQNAKDRSNLAILNPGTDADGDIVVRLTVFSRGSSGLVQKTLADVKLSPGGFTQLSAFLGDLGLTNAFVKLKKIAGAGPVYAYGVINDQGTSDGSFVPAITTLANRGVTELAIPAIVESGAFTTETTFTNTTSSSMTLTLSFVSEKIATSNKTATTSVTLAAGEQLIIPNFVQYLRDRNVTGIGPAGTGYAGPLFITTSASDAQGLFAGAKTSAPGGAATYGVFYPTDPTARFTTVAWVHGLRQDSENRTNLALVNLNTFSTDVFKVEFFDGDTGQAAGSMENISVPARSFLQIGGVLTNATPGTTNAYARITRTSGSSDFSAYVVVNDGSGPGARSGEGAFLGAERDCQYKLPSSVTYGWSGGSTSVSLDTTTGCFWDAMSNDSWITLTSAPSGSSGGGGGGGRSRSPSRRTRCRRHATDRSRSRASRWPCASSGTRPVPTTEAGRARPRRARRYPSPSIGTRSRSSGSLSTSRSPRATSRAA